MSGRPDEADLQPGFNTLLEAGLSQSIIDREVGEIGWKFVGSGIQNRSGKPIAIVPLSEEIARDELPSDLVITHWERQRKSLEFLRVEVRKLAAEGSDFILPRIMVLRWVVAECSLSEALQIVVQKRLYRSDNVLSPIPTQHLKESLLARKIGSMSLHEFDSGFF